MIKSFGKREINDYIILAAGCLYYIEEINERRRRFRSGVNGLAVDVANTHMSTSVTYAQVKNFKIRKSC